MHASPDDPVSPSPAGVVVLVPVLARPERVAPLLTSLALSVRETPLTPLFLLTQGDDAERRAVRAAGASYLELPGPRADGDYARKINIGHANARLAGAAWVFLAADDLCFCRGWADEALAVADRTGAQVVGTNDLGNPAVLRGRASTHTLVSTNYVGTVDDPDVLLSTAYQHNFVDVELVEYAKARGAWAFARSAMVEHLHPSWRKADDDPTYQLGRRGFSADARLFQTRRRLWERRQRPRRSR